MVKKICYKCNEEKYIYKNIAGKKYCKQCAYSVQKPKKIKQVSVKKQKTDVEYSTLRKEFLSNYSFCLAKLTNCTGFATEVHHKSGRSGDNYLNTDTWLPICRSCHTWITEHSREAIELGLSDSRLK